MKNRFCRLVVIAILSLACFAALGLGLAACGGETADTRVTVTLKANGGTFTDGRNTVTVSLDADTLIDGLVPYPVSDDYIFDGWTETENGTELWNLAEKPVKKNVTLYAVWADKVTVTYFANGGEFADECDAKEVQIKKSSAAVLPDAPERDGYKFGGWYKGSVTDGKVTLDEGFAAGTAVDADVTVYAKWAPETGARLPKPTGLTIASDKISWNAVDGAVGYRVYIYNSDLEELNHNDITDESYSYDFTRGGEKEYTVKVRAGGDGVNYINSEYATAKYNYKLTALDASFDVALSELIWAPADDSLPAATSYDLIVYDREDLETPVYSNVDIDATRCDMSQLDAGNYSATIVSKRNNFTSVSTSLTFTKLRLATPQVAMVAETEDGEIKNVKLSWNAIKYASRYIVTIGSNSVMTTALTYTVTDGKLSGNFANFNFTSVAGTVAVRAYDADCDYLVSLPAESLLNKSALVKVGMTNDDTASGRTAASGSLYQYNEAPYTVVFDHMTNLYLRYQGIRYNLGWYEFHIDSNSVISGDLRLYYSETQTVTETKGLSYPKYRLSVFSNYLDSDTNIYVQCGWFTDPACTIPFDLSAPVTRNMTVYGGWTAIPDTGWRWSDITTNLYSYSNPSTTPRGLLYNDFTFAVKRVGTYAASASSNGANVYFITKVAHRYNLRYKNANAGSAYENTVTVYNVTKRTTVKTISVTGTGWGEYNFDGEVGDVFHVSFSHTGSTACDLQWEMGHSNNSTNTLALPSDGKAAPNNYCALLNASATEFYAVKGSVVTLTATPSEGKTFLGWFDKNDNKVSQELTYTFTASAEVAYTAKWSE